MEERLIIDNQSDLSMVEAIERALSVVRKGKISAATVAGEKRQIYCWCTAWGDGVKVTTFPNRKSTRLMIYRDSGP